MNVSGCLFVKNTAGIGGALTSEETILLALEDCIFSQNNASGIGGVMFIFKSQLVFNGTCHLVDNYAKTGGAIYATRSQLDVYNELMVMSNRARYSGGGLYIYFSNLNSHYQSNLNFSSNWAHYHGGGVHAINSLITIYCDRSNRKQALISFIKNVAQNGGGLCLESSAQVYIMRTRSNTHTINGTNLYFTSNSADYGEAIYVTDDTNFEVCSSGSVANRISECFIQALSSQTTTDYNNYDHLVNNIIEFTPNDSSNITNKSIIFGGLLDRCTLDRFAGIIINKGYQIYHNMHHMHVNDGVTFLKMISNLNDVTKDISSLPVKICFCRPDGQKNCSYKHPRIHVKRGESFNVSLIAVDQVNNTVMNVTIHSYLSHAESGLGESQSTQTTKNACTNLRFNVYSPHRYRIEQLILYAEGPCKNNTRSQRRVNITFLNCTCPIGFQIKSAESNNCECVCDSKLNPYINNCNYTIESLTRDGNYWITFINDSNSSGYLIYLHCPLDYCLPSYSNVQINLNVNNGADVQCANNRSGTLCGICQPHLSLSLGTSRCINCSKTWYKQFIVIVIVALLAGIVLVAILMMLNLTVAVGTLNGLIFYANIIGANSSTFFTGSSFATKCFYIFISWLNLELGFDICFFEGMDTYWKTWLQLAFPSYVIFLVIMVMIVSEHSIRFSRLIAKKNPVATLSTLILLSYTMYLRTTITVLSFATLNYPNGSHKKVWLPDATIEYLSGKHIALFIVAIVILIISIAYTCLLFFWQWLLCHQTKIVFKFVKSQQLCHFIEPYHAPYIFKHRYWTGLLLFARVALYLVFALNVSGDPGVNLFAIIIVISSVLFIKGYYGKIYKTNVLDTIEMACYLNVGILCATQLFLLKRGPGAKSAADVPAYISGSIILFLLLAVIIYHGFTEFCSNLCCLKSCKQKENGYNEQRRDINDGIDHPTLEPTSTVVEGKPHSAATDHSEPCQKSMTCCIDEQSNLLDSSNDGSAII